MYISYNDFRDYIIIVSLYPQFNNKMSEVQYLTSSCINQFTLTVRTSSELVLHAHYATYFSWSCLCQCPVRSNVRWSCLWTYVTGLIYTFHIPANRQGRWPGQGLIIWHMSSMLLGWRVYITFLFTPHGQTLYHIIIFMPIILKFNVGASNNCFSRKSCNWTRS